MSACRGGDPLTPQRFQQLGMSFGMSDGFEPVHYLLEEAFADGRMAGDELYVLARVENAQHFDTNPIYAICTSVLLRGHRCNWSRSACARSFLSSL